MVNPGAHSLHWPSSGPKQEVYPGVQYLQVWRFESKKVPSGQLEMQFPWNEMFGYSHSQTPSTSVLPGGQG